MIKQRAARKLTHIWTRFRPVYRQNGVTIPGDEGNIPLYFWEPTWKTELISRYSTASPGLFIDVGANVGQTLLDYCKSPVQGGYVGFEPNPACAARLREIIKSSGLSDCAVIPAALSASTAIIKLHLRGTTDTCATHDGESRPEQGMEAIHIASYRFDDIAEQILRDRPVSLVKIDVERGELDVLSGMERLMSEQRPPIICEVLHHHDAADQSRSLARHVALVDLIQSRGYNIFRIDKTKHEGGLAAFTPVEAFPNEVYSHHNAHLCDYLLFPEERHPI